MGDESPTGGPRRIVMQVRLPIPVSAMAAIIDLLEALGHPDTRVNQNGDFLVFTEDV